MTYRKLIGAAAVVVLASGIFLMLKGGEEASTSRLRTNSDAGAVDQTKPLLSEPNLRGKVAIREVAEKRVVETLAAERRPLPISEKEALARAQAGMERMDAKASYFEPFEVKRMDEARRHAERNMGAPADIHFSYGMDLEDRFVFSGYNGIPDGPGAEKKYRAVFLYGFAVNKSDGKIYRWNEVPEGSEEIAPGAGDER